MNGLENMKRNANLTPFLPPTRRKFRIELEQKIAHTELVNYSQVIAIAQHHSNALDIVDEDRLEISSHGFFLSLCCPIYISAELFFTVRTSGAVDAVTSLCPVASTCAAINCSMICFVRIIADNDF